MPDVPDTVVVVLIAAACAGAVAAVGLRAARGRRDRPRSIRAVLTTAVLTAVLAVVAGTVVTAEAMFLNQHDFGVVLVVCAVAGVIALASGLVVASDVVQDARRIRGSVAQLAAGGRVAVGSLPRTAELAGIARDVEQTADQLVASRDREKALERSRRDLVAWVSHDLRTPLAGLGAMAEALEDGLADDPGRYHKQIRVEVQRLATMVDDLFQLSRLHAGALPQSRQPVDVSDIVSDLIAGCEVLAANRGVDLRGSADGRATVLADPTMLSRALGNLVANAIRHTPSGGAVDVESATETGGVRVRVTDGCGGIAAGDLAHVFDVGWRGTAARTPGPDGGAGLGLAIVHGVVEAHGGSVEVQNVDGGCRFEVRLPMP